MSTKQKKHKYHKLSLISPISHGIIHLCKERRGLYPRGPITENWSSPKQGIPCNAHQNTFSIYYYFIINFMWARGYSTSSGFSRLNSTLRRKRNHGELSNRLLLWWSRRPAPRKNKLTTCFLGSKHDMNLFLKVLLHSSEQKADTIF